MFDALSEDHPGLKRSEVPLLGHAKAVIAHYGFTFQPGGYWLLESGDRRAAITPRPQHDLIGQTLGMRLRSSVWGAGVTKAWEIWDASSQPAEAARWCRAQLGFDPGPVA